MKAIKIISAIMLIIGIGLAMLDNLSGLIASYIIIPVSLLFLPLSKIVFLIADKFTSDKKKNLTYTTTDKPSNNMKTIKMICFSMLIISIGFAIFAFWSLAEHKFGGLALAAMLASTFLFPAFLLLLFFAKISFLISAKYKSHKTNDLTYTTQDKPHNNMKTVKVISVVMLIISVGLAAFALSFDNLKDIGGLFSSFAFILSAFFFISALLLIPLTKIVSAISAEFKT
jgi:hypothetical protein